MHKFKIEKLNFDLAKLSIPVIALISWLLIIKFVILDIFVCLSTGLNAVLPKSDIVSNSTIVTNFNITVYILSILAFSIICMSIYGTINYNLGIEYKWLIGVGTYVLVVLLVLSIYLSIGFNLNNANLVLQLNKSISEVSVFTFVVNGI